MFLDDKSSLSFSRVFDVGGQRSERRKWIHCFDNVLAVIFIAAISEYDQKLREDGATVLSVVNIRKHILLFNHISPFPILQNRVKEALDLFKTVVNSTYFENSAFLLFLNKIDLFREKIKLKPITILFPAYKGQ